MDKTELLFLMMEHPDRYDDQQWQAILKDKDCRELYTIMSLTKGAVAAGEYDRQTDATNVEKGWEAFAAKCSEPVAAHSIWRRIVSAAAVVIICFGIVAAAVHTHCFGLLQRERPVMENARKPFTTTGGATIVADTPGDTTSHSMPHLYDNVPLEELVNDIAARYNLQVEWQTDAARELRLYYQWEPSYSLDKVVEMLNSFESFSIAHENNKLVISDTSLAK